MRGRLGLPVRWKGVVLLRKPRESELGKGVTGDSGIRDDGKLDGGTWDGGGEAGMEKPMTDDAESKGLGAEAAPVSQDANE